MNNETILLIGGTTEARHAAVRLKAEGYIVIVSVATPLGGSLSPAPMTETGRKTAPEIAMRVEELGAAAIVDCTHPFAVQASKEARRAAAIAGVEYRRFTRPPSRYSSPDIIHAGSWQEAVNLLAETGSRALLTIGVRNLELFTSAGLDFVARILPQADSFAECARLGIGPERIIAAWPPFDVEFNRACIRHAKAITLLSKDSGAEGGVPEKLEAALAEGARAIVVARPDEKQVFDDMDALVESLQGTLERCVSKKAFGGIVS